jgi:hypothetical protein
MFLISYLDELRDSGVTNFWIGASGKSLYTSTIYYIFEIDLKVICTSCACVIQKALRCDTFTDLADMYIKWIGLR